MLAGRRPNRRPSVALRACSDPVHGRVEVHLEKRRTNGARSGALTQPQIALSVGSLAAPASSSQAASSSAPRRCASARISTISCSWSRSRRAAFRGLESSAVASGRRPSPASPCGERHLPRRCSDPDVRSRRRVARFLETTSEGCRARPRARPREAASRRRRTRRGGAVDHRPGTGRELLHGQRRLRRRRQHGPLISALGQAARGGSKSSQAAEYIGRPSTILRAGLSPEGSP